MRSLLKNKVNLLCLLFGLILTQSVWSAENEPAEGYDLHMPSVVDNYYSAYPKITVADKAQEELAKRGEYLAKMGDCIACHTNVAGKTPAYAGGLPFHTPFGTFYSPNITPDKETGIGNWTEENFIRAMRDGVDPHGRNYFPVFPFVYFTKLTDEDLRALHVYFQSIPPVRLENKPLPFPFSLPGGRFSLWGWKFLFFFSDKEVYQYDNSKSPEWNRGKYIVDGLGHCSMCHTPLNLFGSPKAKYYLTGGFVDGYWAPNITKYGLGMASDQEIIEVFTKDKLLNNAGPVSGPMKEVNHDSLRYLVPEDLEAMVTYLRTVDVKDPFDIEGSNEPPNLRRGKEIYVTVCSTCHQNGEMAAPVIGDESNWFFRLKDSGLQGLYRHAIDGFNSMPPKGACVTCSDNDIMAASDYILNASLSRSQIQDLKQGGAKHYPVSGQKIYEENCASCHTSGLNGAPKLGDTAVWDKIIEENNMDLLIGKITQGTSGHVVNGGCKHCTTTDILAAVKYILKQSAVKGDYSLW